MTKNDPIAQFEEEQRLLINGYKADTDWQEMSLRWTERAFRQKYMYNFSWLGRPVIQMPAEVVAVQELIWAVKPDLVIETGIAHGGSLILSASMLALLDYCDAVEKGEVLDPQKSKRRVLGIDIDIRAHNRARIEAHPMAGRIDMIQGSSTDPAVIAEVKKCAEGFRRVMVFLDSMHTHDHVLAELEAYAPLTSPGSYCVVFDTIVEDLPDGVFPDRPWCRGNNPRTAVRGYLDILTREGRTATDGAPLKLAVDTPFEDKLVITATPGGYLKRI
jgi:cephalosporin hydroxylase